MPETDAGQHGGHDTSGTSSARYALVIATDKQEGIRLVREVAPTALRDGRIRVVAGDRGREWFPTQEAESALERFFNRARSSGIAADRVRQVAIIFLRFYPKNGNDRTVQADARKLADKIGFTSIEARILRADDPRQFHARLDELGLSDPPVVAEPTTFLEAIEMFAAEFPEDALVLKQARESAAGWDHPRPVDVLWDLRAVHRIYGRWEDKDGKSIDARDRKAVLQAERNTVLAPENPLVQKKYRTGIFKEVGDESICYHLHLKYSYSFTRIYLWFTPKHQRAERKVRTVVVHAGKHLPDGTDNDR